MGKRNMSNGDNTAKVVKKPKRSSESVDKAANGDHSTKLDLTNPKSVFSSLIAPTKLDTFLDSHWEKKPLHIKRNDLSFYGDLFSLEAMKEMLDEHEMNFQSDVNVCRYVNGEKELLNEDNAQITREKCTALLKDKQATLQLRQPQRYSDDLWKLLEKLEMYFGSLVGSNVYITPSGAQGLAPHCDDVEIFVLQLEGEKNWKLYKPMVELSCDYTQDLDVATIGDPIFEETLQPGDLLYLPRGTIHQAKTTDDGHSTHITISTYQQNTWGDFMNHAVTQAIENALEDDVSIRSGLPIDYLSFLGTGRNLSKYIEEENSNEKPISNENEKRVKDFKESIKNHLSKLIDHIDVNTAADSMCEDFMASRLPPFGHVVRDDSEIIQGKVPTLESKIKIKYPDHVRVRYSDEDETEENVDITQFDGESDSEEEDEKSEKRQKTDEKPKASPKKDSKMKSSKSETEDDEEEEDEDVNALDEEPCIKILHSLNNDHELHLSGGEPGGCEANCLKLPVHFGRAAVALLNAFDFVPVKELALDEDEDKMKLATALYSDDLIEVQ